MHASEQMLDCYAELTVRQCNTYASVSIDSTYCIFFGEAGVIIFMHVTNNSWKTCECNAFNLWTV